MKNLLLFSSVCFALSGQFSVLHGQITITQSDMPNANDTLRVSYSNDTINPTLTGANYLWDYSYLTPYAQWVEKFDDPSSFPSPFNLIFNPFNTSYGQEIYTPDSVFNIKPDNAYAFLKESSTQYKRVGVGFTINTIPVPIMYNPADVIYRFPLQYGNKDSSDAAYGFNLPPPNGPYYGQFIHRVNEADGWGTLITPFGTFQTLRIKSTITVRDTFADTSGNGFSNTRPPRYEFKWLKQGGKIPYLQVDANDVLGIPVVTQVTYRDSMRNVFQIGVNEFMHPVLGLQIYPNPAGKFVFISYSLIKSERVQIALFDLRGRKIWTLLDKKQTDGAHFEFVNLAEKNLPGGIYFIKVRVGDSEENRKIIIQ
jgi:hypothetical protein